MNFSLNNNNVLNNYNRKEREWENIKFTMKINFMIIIIVLNWKKIERNKKKTSSLYLLITKLILRLILYLRFKFSYFFLFFIISN